MHACCTTQSRQENRMRAAARPLMGTHRAGRLSHHPQSGPSRPCGISKLCLARDVGPLGPRKSRLGNLPIESVGLDGVAWSPASRTSRLTGPAMAEAPQAQRGVGIRVPRPSECRLPASDPLTKRPFTCVLKAIAFQLPPGPDRRGTIEV